MQLAENNKEKGVPKIGFHAEKASGASCTSLPSISHAVQQISLVFLAFFVPCLRTFRQFKLDGTKRTDVELFASWFWPLLTLLTRLLLSSRQRLWWLHLVGQRKVFLIRLFRVFHCQANFALKYSKCRSLSFVEYRAKVSLCFSRIFEVLDTVVTLV